jgi:hypothetical protein
MSQDDGTERSGEKGSQEFTPAVAFAMGEIKGAVENLRTDLREWKDDVKGDMAADRAINVKKLDDIETRLRFLEKWFWRATGAAAAGGFGGAKVVEWLANMGKIG